MNLIVKQPAPYFTLAQWISEDSEHDGIPAHQTIPADSHVDYLGHVPGGMVKVQYDGQPVIIDPNTTVELADEYAVCRDCGGTGTQGRSDDKRWSTVCPTCRGSGRVRSEK